MLFGGEQFEDDEATAARADNDWLVGVLIDDDVIGVVRHCCGVCWLL